MRHESDVQLADPKPLSGKKMLVIGGSRGIAAAIACRAVELGARIVVHYSSKSDAAVSVTDVADNVLKCYAPFGVKPELIDIDLTTRGGGDEVVQRAQEMIGGVDTLLLSASIQVERPLTDQSADEIDAQIDLNLRANITMLQRVLPQMVANGYGRVLSIGSVQELAPSPRMPVYAMTKSAMKTLIECLALQYANTGITLNTLSPGLIETPRNARFRTDQKLWDEIQANANPMGRSGQVEELVPSAIHFLSPDSSFITGATLYAAGGSHIPSADGLRRRP